MRIRIICLMALLVLYGANELAAQGTCATAVQYTIAECNSFFPNVTLTTDDDSGGVNPSCTEGSLAYWYEVTVPAGFGGIGVSLPWSSVGGPGSEDLRMSIYSGSCGALVSEVDCEDVRVFGARYEYPLAPGTYYVRFSDINDDGANFDVAFNNYQSGDDPNNPVDLETANGLYCNFSAQGEGCANGVSGNCLFTEDNSIYYSFSVDASTQQPVEFGLENIVCAGEMQIQVINLDCTRVVDNNGVTLNAVCQIVTGDPAPQYVADLPVGDYLLIVDGESGDLCSWGLTSTIIQPSCPDLSAVSPAEIVIDTESTCTTFGGSPTGGAYSAPVPTNCPAGSTLEYSIDGGTFSATLPTYNSGTSETITTRCTCDSDGSITSTVSSGVSSTIGVCPTCSDQMMNGAETGVDCGGPDCPACPPACVPNAGNF